MTKRYNAGIHRAAEGRPVVAAREKKRVDDEQRKELRQDDRDKPDCRGCEHNVPITGSTYYVCRECIREAKNG